MTSKTWEVHTKQGKNGNWYWAMYRVERNAFGDILKKRWQFGCAPMGELSEDESLTEARNFFEDKYPIYDSTGFKVN